MFILADRKHCHASYRSLRSGHTRWKVAATHCVDRSLWLMYRLHDELQEHVAVTHQSDKSLCVYRRIFVTIFVSATSCKKHNQTESVQLFAATKFCCRDKDFHKNYPVHAKRFIAAMCHCDMLYMSPSVYWPLPVQLPVLCYMILVVQKSVNIKVLMICPGCKIWVTQYV